METLAPTSIKTVKLSEVKNLEHGNYIVEHCEDTACIYKLLENTANNKLTLQIYKQYGSGFFGNKNSVQANMQEPRRIYGERIKIHILTNDGTSLALVPEIVDRWCKAIKVGNSGISIRLDYNYEEKFPLIEELNAIRIWGCNFPVSMFDDAGTSPNLMYSVNKAKQLPCDLSQRDVLNRLLSKTCTGKAEWPVKLEGITKTVAKIKPFLESVDFFSRIAVITAAENCKRTINNVKFSVVFNKLFEKVETVEEFAKIAMDMSNVLWANSDYCEKLMDTLPDARDIKKAALKRKSTGAFNKIMDDLDFVKIDPETHPLTHAAVYSGDIPTGTFFKKSGESYFVYNDNWDLWEFMLKDHKDIAIEIAKSCSGRTTYEKDLMSYFYFTLYGLPEYLEQQTGKKWKGIPKLVNSSDELEPPKEGSNGVSKSRSALTPIVDNEKCTITVPYVSMQIGGYQTTYCYGLNYDILKRGFSFNGNTVTKDVEKKLNGRDDYGLMFYTLTGTAQGRGYPTFLIIFERLENKTEVHFHRTHPMRSKGGDYNPIHNWTTGCYKWMIGNVNFERIKAQQGDLAFVEIDKFPEGEPTKVNGYDSHMFLENVDYLPYTKKDNQNVLGYINLTKPTQLSHTHHMNRIIPAGVYEIRQCRSWEANPKGIWSLRID